MLNLPQLLSSAENYKPALIAGSSLTGGNAGSFASQ